MSQLCNQGENGNAIASGAGGYRLVVRRQGGRSAGNRRRGLGGNDTEICLGQSQFGLYLKHGPHAILIRKQFDDIGIGKEFSEYIGIE